MANFGSYSWPDNIENGSNEAGWWEFDYFLYIFIFILGIALHFRPRSSSVEVQEEIICFCVVFFFSTIRFSEPFLQIISPQDSRDNPSFRVSIPWINLNPSFLCPAFYIVSSAMISSCWIFCIFRESGKEQLTFFLSNLFQCGITMVCSQWGVRRTSPLVKICRFLLNKHFQ